MLTNFKLQKPQTKGLDTRNYQFRKLLGCLLCLSVCTRPDISFACSQLSQFNHDYDKTHWQAEKHILRYLAVFIKMETLSNMLMRIRVTALWIASHLKDL